MAYNDVFYEISDLEDLNKQLNQFIEDVEREKELMLSETDEMNYYWKDDQYRKFRNYMVELADDIDKCNVSLAKSSEKLEQFIFELLRDM